MTWLVGVAAALGTFVLITLHIKDEPRSQEIVHPDRVVVSAPVQLVLYAGDRYLAANVETIRASVTGLDIGSVNLEYLIRAQNVASELNPCHEDNYYIANALLTFGGGEQQASAILDRAVQCRFWDEMPPFYQAFNQYSFHRNYEAAKRSIDLAIERSTTRVTFLRQFAATIQADSLKDEELAFAFLTEEADKARDPKLKQALALRADRLNGLLILRKAQAEWESRYARKLNNPQQLLESGLLKNFPQDPLKIGYRFSGGMFRLNELSAR